VYAKTTKATRTVRKLVLWKTNKHELNPAHPPYVVHWTDYSPDRKDPLKREVRIAPDEATAQEIAEEMIASNIKKGWERLDDPTDGKEATPPSQLKPSSDSINEPASTLKTGDSMSQPSPKKKNVKKAGNKTEVSAKKSATTNKKATAKKNAVAEKTTARKKTAKKKVTVKRKAPKKKAE
jgi:hypothetical protein